MALLSEGIEGTGLLFGTTLHMPVSCSILMRSLGTPRGLQMEMDIAGGLCKYLEIGLLLICKQIYHEVIQTVYENSAFVLQSWPACDTWQTRVRCLPNLSRIRFLTMELDGPLQDKYGKGLRKEIRNLMANIILPLMNLDKFCLYRDYSLFWLRPEWPSCSRDWRLSREMLLFCAAYVPIRHSRLTAPPLWAVRDGSYTENDPFIDLAQYRQGRRLFQSVTMGSPYIRGNYVGYAFV